MNFIPQMQPWFDGEEKAALNAYMDEGGFLTEFKHTSEFEQEIAKFTHTKHCIATNNGTISLSLAALAVGLKAGDEVLVPNYTMIATPNSLKLFGAKPVFVDVERETLCMDLEKAKAAITPKTRAIMLVLANGRYPKSGIENFVNLCKEKGLILIEDAAQALGSFYENGAHMGSVGAVGSFSFSAPKVISTGQGGALITNDDEIAARLRKLKDFGRSGGGNDIHDTIGYNFKFTELQAVVGLVQMKKLNQRLKRKKEIYTLYEKAIRGVSGIVLFKQDLEHTTPWFYDTLCEKRDDLISFLKAANIGTRVMYPPINKQKAYENELSQGCKKGDFEMSNSDDFEVSNSSDFEISNSGDFEKSNSGGFKMSDSSGFEVSNLVGKKGLWLPSFTQISDEQISYICEKIREFYGA